MKKIIFCLAAVLLLTVSGIFAQKTSPYFSKVVEYKPAPGQFINENFPTYTAGDNQAAINAKVHTSLTNAGGMITLGGYGGYVILAFDEPIANVGKAPYDFKVYGNAFAGSAEPGIVMVSFDANGNGEADDAWYELAGSEYNRCLKDYRIEYVKPNPLNGDVKWINNQGDTGFIKRNNFHKQASYYPLWIDKDTLAFEGTLFPDSLQGKAKQWGYADNVHNDSTGCRFKISWAVDKNGNSVVLPAVHFVKIYTAINKASNLLGEVSTEVQYPGVEDLHPAIVYEPLVEPNNLVFNKEYHILNTAGMLALPDTIWGETFYYNPALDPGETGSIAKTFTKDTFLFNLTTSYYEGYGSSWSGVTYSNKTDDTTGDYSNEFSAITARGVDSVGSSYLVAFDVNTIEFAGQKSYRIAGTYITNSTLAYYIMKDGNPFAKKFGGNSGLDPDWFKVTFTGVDVQGDTTGSVDYYLADFRSDNPKEDYIVKNWRWVDLSSLGKVAKVQYSFSGSDVGSWGLNTPAYFCMDKIAAEKHNTNAYLAEIKADNTNIENVNADKLHYQLYIENDVVTIPVITAIPADSNAVLDITNAVSFADTTKIVVTAEDGITTKIYTITYLKQSSNACLAWIKANNENITDLDAEKFNYTVTLPNGTVQVPLLTAVAADTNATVTIKQAATLSDTSVITVVSLDGSTTQTYSISFIVTKGTNADLAWIKVNGVEITNFEPYLFNYTVLVSGTPLVPIITAATEDINAKLEITTALNLSDSTKIVVTSEDGNYKQTYYLKLVLQAGVNDLSMAQVKVYPNPVQDYLHVTGINNCNIIVYDISGKKVFTEKANTSTLINTTTWQKGIYIVQLNNGKITKAVKVVKE